MVKRKEKIIFLKREYRVFAKKIKGKIKIYILNIYLSTYMAFHSRNPNIIKKFQNMN